MTITLYPDQQAYIDKVREALRSHRRIVAQAYCGFGKTCIAAEMTNKAFLRGRRVLFAVHRREIRRQTMLTFRREGIPFGVVGQDAPQQVMIGTMPAIRNRLGRLPADLLFIDEGHIYASGFAKVHEHYDQAKAFMVALTATPERFGRQGMGQYYDHIVEGPSARWLIDNGRLSDYKLFAPELVDPTGTKIRQGEYATAEVEAIMDKPTITGDAIVHWRRYANNLRTIVFCASVKHSVDVAEQFNSSGIPTAHMDATTPEQERGRIIHDFADGRISVLTNCMLATEGFDLSAQVGRDVAVEAVVMLRPTKSLPLFIQMSGRALRKKDKPAIILDHVRNTHEHGLPDEDRTWSLESRKKRTASKTYTCKHCFGVFAEYFTVCPSCGHVRPAGEEGRAGPVKVDGELKEVDVEEVRKRKKPVYSMEFRKAGRSLDALKEYAAKNGFKESWATYRWNARQQKLSRA